MTHAFLRGISRMLLTNTACVSLGKRLMKRIHTANVSRVDTDTALNAKIH